ncbi:SDR family NAD(P)-dependent oxidoreductase [Paraburkholderia sp. EB58]|jgi:NAD(P)-dependent dehydrogenase (short-subunit alcohol dehydrogenase family)|uniref:SDR family NAD(P)-dependent oxidoreductase n=1 Tax=Paraburkholderia sp. EB58 TaxID=3035125 RepID=UPI003D2124A0
MVEGKVVVVTGAGSGIGRDLAKAFAANGAKVIVNDTGRAVDSDGFAAEQVVAEIRAAAGEAAAAVESVASNESAQRIVQAALDHFGRIDCVVNNAGITRDRIFFNMSEEEWRAVLDVHLNGSFYVARAAAPHFKSQASGSYIHMTSTSGLVGNVGQANYAAAKMGIVGLSKSLAMDMAKFKVRSNCVSPWAWTSMTANIPADTPENMARIEKLKKMESAKIAPLAVYLGSDQAVDVSGQIFGVRANEIYLFSQPRILRTLHRSDGWTPETIAEHAIPALASNFYENVPSMAITPWDPI